MKELITFLCRSLIILSLAMNRIQNPALNNTVETQTTLQKSKSKKEVGSPALLTGEHEKFTSEIEISEQARRVEITIIVTKSKRPKEKEEKSFPAKRVKTPFVKTPEDQRQEKRNAAFQKRFEKDGATDLVLPEEKEEEKN
jgi:hypothetical protein